MSRHSPALVSPPVTWQKAASAASSAITRGSPKRSPGARRPSCSDGKTTASRVVASGGVGHPHPGRRGAGVGRHADVAQRLEVLACQAAPDAKVAGVIDGGLHPQGPTLLEVGLDLGGPVVDLQVRVDVGGDQAGLKTPRGSGADAAVHDQADLVGSAKIQVLADGRLKPGPAGLWPGETREVCTSNM